MVFEICPEERCTGCMACSARCPLSCIAPRIDQEGFVRPEIDGERCVECGACKRVCPAVSGLDLNPEPRSAYLFRTKDRENMIACASGGAFVDLSKSFLASWEKRAAFGVSYDDQWAARHSVVFSIDHLGSFSGSKYSQSDIGDSFSEAKDLLESGYGVVFSGVPCQIAGLKQFLGKEYDNLLCIDLICHGVGSPQVFSRYAESLEKKNGSKLVNFCQTLKINGWMGKRVFARFENGNVYSRMAITFDDPYMTAFLKHVIMRPSCYECEFTRLTRAGDLTIGDAWGVERQKPRSYYQQGVSLVLASTRKGFDAIRGCSSTAQVEEVDIGPYLASNPQLQKHIDKPENRDSLIRLAVSDASFESFSSRLKYRSRFRRLLSEIKSQVNNLVF